MFQFFTGLFIGIFIGQTFIVPNIQNCVIQTMKKLEHYKKKSSDDNEKSNNNA